MPPDEVGQGSIRIVPDVSGFETQLRAQLQPILDRVGAQMAPSFARTGQQAGQAFGKNLAAGIGTEAGRGIPAAVQRATERTSRQVSDAGITSGRVFGTGFGEGFAALAAFAIARRVEVFFRETVQQATEFETAFAGVRRVVETNAEGFDRLRQSIISMSERLPFAASGIANVVAEAGRIGVPAQNLQAFSETILKFSTITGQAADQAAISIAKFISVTQGSFADTGHLTDVILKLGTAFAANEQEVLKFSQRLAPLATLSKSTSEDVLALATGIVQAGGRAESGGTAIIRAFNLMQKAAQEGGTEALKFARVIGVDTPEAFQRLLATDPTETFVRLLEGIRREGTGAGIALQNLGLGSQRSGIQLTQLAASSEAVREALSLSKDAAGELDRQFKIFLRTPAAQFQLLHNQIQNTRIELGAKLAPALIGLLKPIAGLSTATVGLVAAFAGLAAGGFAFIRFGNILDQFRLTLVGSRLSAVEAAAGIRLAQAAGISFSEALRIANQQGQTFTQIEQRIAAGGETMARGFSLAQAGAVGFAGQIRIARDQLTLFNAFGTQTGGQVGAALHSTEIGARSTAEAMLLMARSGATGQAGLLAAARAAVTAQGAFGALVGVVAKVSIALLALDLVRQGLDAVASKLRDLRTPEPVEDLAKVFLDAAEGSRTFADAASQAGIDFKRNFGSVLDNLTRLRPEDFIPGFGDQVKKEVDKADKALAVIAQSAPDRAKEIFEGLVEEGARQTGKLPEEIRSRLEGVFDDYIKAIAGADLQTRLLGQSSDGTAGALGDLSGALAGTTGSADAAANALSRIQAAQQEFQSRVQSLIRPVSGIISLYEKSGKAATKSGRDTRSAARAIADAEKTLARAREEAADRIADAQRKLAEAEREAIERILDARRRLEESRIDSTRSLRDATENLQDFEAALAQVGGPQTQEDFIRLRELQEALADATEDAAQKEIEGQRAVQEARDDGARKIEESQRRLAEVIEENQQRIADALERLARAHEDAHGRAAAAAAKAADKIVLSTAQITKGFRDNAAQLNTFAGLLEGLFPRLTRVFGDQNLAEAFLADLNEMGTDAIPILKNLVGSSDKQLAGLGKAFESQIKAAKRAADLQFKRFPPNFKAEFGAAIDTIIGEIERGVDEFDALPDAALDMKTKVVEQLGTLRAEFEHLATAANLQLTAAEQSFFELSQSAKDPAVQVKALRDLINSLRSRNIDVNAELDFKLSPEAKAFLKKLDQSLSDLGITGVDFFAKGGVVHGPVAHAQFGSTAQAGFPLIVGEKGPELFIPSTAGAVFTNHDTERILKALRVTNRGGGNIINVYEVAQSPLATARAVSFEIGSNGAVR